MLYVKALTLPSPEQYNVVIKGMRNAYKGQDKSDSGISYNGYAGELIHEIFNLGKEDKDLLMRLTAKGDPSHRKLLRQLPVIFEINAPLYWWKQLDTYKVGTTANSESTMHTLPNFPFTLEDFNTTHLSSIEEPDGLGTYENVFNSTVIAMLNELREKYLETKDRKYWHAMNELLPHSYRQTRTWSANYEVLLNILRQRKNHPLTEWKDFIDYILNNVPYLKDLDDAQNGEYKINK